MELSPETIKLIESLIALFIVSLVFAFLIGLAKPPLFKSDNGWKAVKWLLKQYGIFIRWSFKVIFQGLGHLFGGVSRLCQAIAVRCGTRRRNP